MPGHLTFRHIAGIAILFSITSYNAISGQDRISLTAGFGIPDLINAGVRYQLKNDSIQIGLNYGFAQGDKTYSCNLYFNLLGKAKLSPYPPWYLKGSFAMLYFKDDLLFAHWNPVFSVSAGRDFYFSKKFGLDLEAGIMHAPNMKLLLSEISFMPCFGFQFFIKI